MSKRLTYLSILIILLEGCTKKYDNTIRPGSVSGFVSPAVAISVCLDTSTGGQKYSVQTNADGAFNFQNVLPGSYSLRVVTTAIYTSTPLSLIITPNSNTSIGNILLNYYVAAQTGLINFLIDRTGHTIFYNHLQASYLSGTLNLSGVESSTTDYYNLSMKMLNVKEPGTYSMYNSPSYFLLKHFTSLGNCDGNWTTDNGGSGTLNINTLDTISRSVTGTFSGILFPQGASAGTKQITVAFTNCLY